MAVARRRGGDGGGRSSGGGVDSSGGGGSTARRLGRGRGANQRPTVGEAFQGLAMLALSPVVIFFFAAYKCLLAFPFRDVTDYQAPPAWVIRLVVLPLNFFFPLDATSELDGLGLGADEPVIYVANHTLWGVDMLPIGHDLFRRRGGRVVRGLADRFHMAIPGHKHLLQYFGAVLGSPEVCEALMEAKQDILVYPGGAEEVMKKRSDPKYALLWKERTGFARFALRHGYTIVPVASVGMEEALSIWFDVPVGVLLYYVMGDARYHITAPVLKPWCTPQKLYAHYGRPIRVPRLDMPAGADGEAVLRQRAAELRDEVKEAVRAGIETLRRRQVGDPDRYTFPWLCR